MISTQNPRTPCARTAADLYRLLAQGQFDLSTEAATQRDMQQLLRDSLPLSMISREHRLGAADRPDFLIDARLVIEVKGPRHQPTAVQRQLARYAAYAQVAAIILATSRAMHMPPLIGGKPVRVLNLGRAWL